MTDIKSPCARLDGKGTGWIVAIRLEETRVAVANWLALLAGVVITVASPLFLVQIIDAGKSSEIGGAIRNAVFWLYIIGLVLSAISLYLGLLFYYLYTKGLRLNPHYYFGHLKRLNEADEQECLPVYCEHLCAVKQSLRVLFLQVGFFCIGMLLILSSVFVFAIAIY